MFNFRCSHSYVSRRALRRADAFKQAHAQVEGDEDGDAGGANEAYAFLPQVLPLGKLDSIL